MSGELEDRHFIITRGDSRIAMTIARNRYTVKFDRERRFLIDDEESPHKLSFVLSKPLKVGLTYGGKGVFKFVLQEATATGDDNHELGVADYYKLIKSNQEADGASDADVDEPTDEPIEEPVGESTNVRVDDNGKRVWF